MSSVSETPTSFNPLTTERSILKAAKGGGIVLFGMIFSYAVRLVLGIVMTRLLGADEFGLYRLALSAATIGAGIGIFGLEFALVRYISMYASRGDSARLWGTIQVGLGLVTIISTLIGAGFYALATPLAIHVFEDSRLIPLIQIGSLIVPLLALSKALISATRGFSEMQYAIFSQEIMQPVLRLALIAAVAIVGLNAVNSLIIFIVGLIATCGLLFYYLNHLFPLKRPIGSAIRDVGGVLRFSLPAYLSVLITTFQSNFQTILLGGLNSAFTVGVFSVASQVSKISTIFNSSIGTASSPIIAELHDQGDRDRISNFYQTTAKWMFAMNLPIFLIVILFARTILTIFGEDFDQGYVVLLILMWANLLVAMVGIADDMLNMSGNTHFRLINAVIQITVSVILSFLLIPTWGATGAAIVVLVARGTVNFLRVIQVYITMKMLPYNVSILKPVLAGIMALTIGWATKDFIQSGTNLVVTIVISFELLIVYIGVIFLLGLSAEDRVVLARAQARIRSLFSRI